MTDTVLRSRPNARDHARADKASLGRGLGDRRCAYKRVKRLLDIVVAGCALLLTWPVIAAAMLLIKLTSPGPPLYRARRAGLGGRAFDLLKLRTMRVGADTPDRRITAERDDRVTAVGRILRRFAIDELPQFWNVLRGEMSIVGPRPEDWDLVQRCYTSADRRSLDIRPGVVSPSTVRWYPDYVYHDPPPPGVPLQEHYIRRHLPVQVAEAIEYIGAESFLVDVTVIAQTLYCIAIRSWRPPARKPIRGVERGRRSEGGRR